MKRRMSGIFIAAVMIITSCSLAYTPVLADEWSEDWGYQEDTGAQTYDNTSEEQWAPNPAEEGEYGWGDVVEETVYEEPAAVPTDVTPLAVQIIDLNGVSYVDFTKAINGSQNGDVLKLTSDVVLAAPVTVEWTWEGMLTLDLNGHKIRMYGSDENITADNSGTWDTEGKGGVFVLKGGTFRIIDSAKDDPYASQYGSIYSSNKNQPVFKLVQTSGVPTTLVVEGGSMSNDMNSSQPLIGLEDAYGYSIAPEDLPQSGAELKVSVTGGSFGQKLPDGFIAQGYEQYQSQDGWWNIQTAQSVYYTVTFDSMADDVADPESQSVQEGLTATDPGALYREGYTFDGWYDIATGAWYDFTAPVYADINLGAWWTENAPNTYTVTFSSQAEGIAAPEPQTVEEGLTATDPGPLSREGYTFDGWYDLATGNWYDFTAPVYADINLGAWWTENAPNTYTVTFDSQADDVYPPASQQVEAGYTAADPGALVRSGYNFRGWFSDPEAITPYYFDSPVNSDITIYAGWERVYEPLNPGANVYTKGSSEGIIFQIDAPYSNFTGIKIDGNYVDPSNYYSWEGSTYVQLKPEYADQMASGSHSVEFDFTDGYCVTQFAVAEPEITTYTVTFSFNGLKADPYLVVPVQARRRVDIPPQPVGSDGYAFAGWFNDTACTVQYDFNTPVLGDMTLYAKWNPVETMSQYYSVTFYTAHGRIPDGQLVEYGKQALRPEDPVEQGYVFEGWYSDIEYINAYDFNAPVTADITLYAKWSEQQTTAQYYTVYYYTNRGSAPAAQSVQKGHIATKPADPTAQGYVFGGWFTDRNYQYPYDFNTPVTADITLYARWAELPAQNYIVSFDANGHGDAPNPQTVSAGAQAARPADPSASGYTFSGWFTDSACTAAYDFRTPVNYDVTLYAKWLANSYTVRFDANTGSGTMQSQVYRYGERAVLPANQFTRSGYYFIGWNTSADGSGQVYADKAEVLNLTVQQGATVDLYAQWKNIYSVIEGAGAKVQRGTKNGITFRVDGDYSKFTGIRIDGNNVASSAYTSWSGTYVQIKPEYINQMTAEAHTIRFMFTDGACETRFEVVSGTPTTGDTNNMIIWIIIAIAALLVIAITVLLLIRRRRQSASGGYYDDDYDNYDDDDDDDRY